MLQVLNSEEVFIEYMYAFSMNEAVAVIVIRPVNIQKCMEILQNNKEGLLFTDDNYQL